MLKRSLFLIASLSLVLALVVSSCQKDDVIKSEEKTGSKSTQQSSGNKDFTAVIEALAPKFKLDYIFFTSGGVTADNPTVRVISVKFNKLEPAITESNQYYVHVTNHYEKSNNVFGRIDITDIIIRDDKDPKLWGLSAIEYDKLFTDEGTGNGELRFSLIRKLNLMNIFLAPSFASIKYTKESKKMFNRYKFQPDQD